MSSSRLIRYVNKLTNVETLQKVKLKLLDKLIQRGDIDQSDKTEFETLIDQRIAELS